MFFFGIMRFWNRSIKFNRFFRLICFNYGDNSAYLNNIIIIIKPLNSVSARS